MLRENEDLQCAGCRRLKPWREFRWVFQGLFYCSQRCLAQAMRDDHE